MKNFGLSLILLAALGCSTSSKESRLKILALSDIELLDIGKTQSADIKSSFGTPDRIASLSKNEEIWVYFDHGFNEPAIQRASFVIDKTTGILMSATWIPGESDPIHRQQYAPDHFKGHSFVAKNTGLVAHHHYSDEVLYKDARSGVSLRTNSASRTVTAISFGPKSAAPIASQP